MATSKMHAKSNAAMLGTNDSPNGGLITGEKIDALHIAAQLCPIIDQSPISSLTIL